MFVGRIGTAYRVFILLHQSCLQQSDVAAPPPWHPFLQHLSACVYGVYGVSAGRGTQAAAKRWRMVRLHKQTKEALSPGNTFGEGGGAAGNVYEHRQRHKVVQNVLAMAAAVTRTSGLTPARRRAE